MPFPDMECKFKASGFTCIHRSYLINMDKVDEEFGNIVKVCGVEIPISKRKKDEAMGLIRYSMYFLDTSYLSFLQMTRYWLTSSSQFSLIIETGFNFFCDKVKEDDSDSWLDQMKYRKYTEASDMKEITTRN